MARPDLHRPLRALLLEHGFPVVVAHGDKVAVVVEVEEGVARAIRLLPGEVGKR